MKLHLSKTDCVRAFQLANSVGNSDGDAHEMDLEEFCQCVLFLAKLAGFLGEGDKVPLASKCNVEVAECVSKMLTLLGCIVPEVGNRSSRNMARMKRQGSRGKSDALGPSFSVAQASPLAHIGEHSEISGSAESVSAAVASHDAGCQMLPHATAAPSSQSPSNDDGSQHQVLDDSISSCNGVKSAASEAIGDGIDAMCAKPNDSLNGNLEKVAISSLQSSFCDMNLLPEHKWFHFASSLAQAGVSSIRDLLHLGSDDAALVKFLSETCGMNIIQGKKVAAFLKATT